MKYFPKIIACLFLLAFGVGVWLVFARPFESPRDCPTRRRRRNLLVCRWGHAVERVSLIKLYFTIS